MRLLKVSLQDANVVHLPLHVMSFSPPRRAGVLQFFLPLSDYELVSLSNGPNGNYKNHSINGQYDPDVVHAVLTSYGRAL